MQLDQSTGGYPMKLAVPLADGVLCNHFGHCQQFAVLTVEANEIQKKELLSPPPHEPGVLPSWLHGLGVDVIIAGGMGRRALDLFAQNGIEVVVGAPNVRPEDLVKQYLDRALPAGINVCDH
jgi:ATP-binding protein involved in chromosome partitioning